jgi:hypothetical protein
MSRAVALLALAAAAYAQDARQIMDEAQKRTESRSQRYEGTLRTDDGKGRVTERRWRYERLGSHGEAQAMLRFTAPAEVKGIALLVKNQPDRASDQWMYQPSIGRDRRIAFQDRRQRFFGTDFTFEDLEEREANQYEYKLLGEDAIDGAPCWKIESRPKESKRSQYSHSYVWVRKDNYAVAQADNYRDGKVTRRARYRRIENVQGIWTARELEMSDLERGSRTVMTVDKLEYNLPLKQDQFTLQAMRQEL